MTAYVETEVKLYAPHLEIIQVRLERLGADLTVPRSFERNVRYENAARTLDAAGIVVRLREDTRVRLTYKEGGETASGVVSRFEAEVEVNDFAAMDTILRKLGYTPYMVYEKYRTTYIFAGVEVVLDELPYGSFIEIEGEPGAIEAAIERLDLHDAPRHTASYTALFERVRRSLKLDFQDLTFTNFNGLNVPASAFSD